MMPTLLIVIALVAPAVAFAPRGAAALDNDPSTLDRLEAEIVAIEARDGPDAEHLIEPLAALGAYYQEQGDDGLALAATQRARELVRKNFGLYSLDQAPLIRRLMDSEESIGDPVATWNLEQDLLLLAERHPGDQRTVQIFRETADRRIDVLNRYRAGEWPAEVYLGCYYHPARRQSSSLGLSTNCRSGSRSTVEAGLAADATRYYGRAINIIISNREYDSSDLPGLLTSLLYSSYALGNSIRGERSLRNVLAYQNVETVPWTERLETITQLGDWLLLNADGGHDNQKGLRVYLEAYRLLVGRTADPQLVERIFSPPIPVVLPSFAPNPLDTAETVSTRGHIDIAFDVTKYGKSDAIEVIEAAGNATRADEKDLVQLILRSRFRPRVTSGGFADASRVTVRYYLND
jgi:hypothetical protein